MNKLIFLLLDVCEQLGRFVSSILKSFEVGTNWAKNKKPHVWGIARRPGARKGGGLLLGTGPLQRDDENTRSFAVRLEVRPNQSWKNPISN